jgi:hypothetical protein
MGNVREFLPSAYEVPSHAGSITKVGDNSSHHDHGTLDYCGKIQRIGRIFIVILFLLCNGDLMFAALSSGLRLDMKHKWK